jgi:hypothetical protein
MATNSETRNMNLSMRFRLWGILRQNNWFNNYDSVDLTLLTGNDEITNEPYPANTYVYSGDQKAFVFIDQYNEPWPSGVVVYDMGNVRNPSTYKVNYEAGRITFIVPPSGTITADLTVFSAQVRRGYPKEHELELIDLPVVAYKCETDDGTPFMVGSATQENAYYYNIFIMASNDGEQADLTSDIRKNIRFVPYVDYSDHQPLDENNALDLEFSYADQLVSRLFIMHGINGTYLDPRPGGSDKEEYRSLVAFEVKRIS